MAAIPTELKAQAREGVGKGAARQLRRQGLIPAVIYGDKKAPLPISIGYNDALRRIYAGGFLSHILIVDVDGTKHRVIPRDYQLDVVKDTPLHVDFLRIGAGSRIHVEVHVAFINEDKAPGIKRGGVLNVVHHTLDVTCPADAIPEQIVIDLEGKDIGDSVHIGDVTLPSGVEPHSHEADMTIATIVAPSGLRSEEATEGTAAPEAGTATQE
jgi:large subunit ribosomal protein L25